MGWSYRAQYEGYDIYISEDGNDGAHYIVTKGDRKIVDGYFDHMFNAIDQSIAEIDADIAKAAGIPLLNLEDRRSLDRIATKAQRILDVDNCVKHTLNGVEIQIRKYKHYS